ncbi:unnamed protein product, partial [marine sediment metagenome]
FMITEECDEVDEVKLVFVNDGGCTITGVYPMVKASGNDYYCNVTVSLGDNYNYYIWADDTSGNENTSSPRPFDLPTNWDVNMDGHTHFFDLAAIVIKYKQYGPPGWIREDVNNDGDIGFFDLANVVIHYDEYW